MGTRRVFVALGLAIAAGIVLAGYIGNQVVTSVVNLDADHFMSEDTIRLTETVAGDRLLFAWSIDVNETSTVTGDVALIAETINIDGRITGDVVALGDSLRLGPDAQIDGDLLVLADTVVVNGQVNGALDVRADTLRIEPAARLAQFTSACIDQLSDMRGAGGDLPPCGPADLPLTTLPVISPGIPPGPAGLFSTLVTSLTLAALSILAVVVFPQHISHIAEAVRSSPRTLGGVGCLALVVGVGVLFAFAVLLVIVPPLGLLLLLPLLLALLVFLGAVLAGWVTIALLSGDFLLRRLARVALPPLIAAAVGNLALIAVWHLLALIPYGALVGLIGLGLLGLVGLGGTLHTRAGTRPQGRRYLVQG